MKTINPDDFKITKAINLSEIPTSFNLKAKEDTIEDELDEVRETLSKLQDIMYAHNKYSVLICLQGMDTSGKDSLIREVFKEFNPRGVDVQSFKTPNTTELEHDYLWRHYIVLPEKGKFAVFNRSHYENVIVTRVHKEYLLKENLPGIKSVDDVNDQFWQARFNQINNFESHITQNGMIVMKFFLHLSKEEQRERLLRRLEEKVHNWKFSPGDLEERSYWTKYQQYYSEAISNTSKENAPWFVIPADDKDTARYLTGKIILETLQKYTDIKEPELTDDVKENMSVFIKELAKEKA